MGTTITSNQVTPVKLRRPVKTKETNERCVYTYFNSETKNWDNVEFYKYGWGAALVKVAEQINKHAFENKGVITRATAIEMLQEIHKIQEKVVTLIKDLFELYMDKSSDGGENITQDEQSRIMTTIAHWDTGVVS